MALPLRERWDVTHLAAKYPWLRVDQAALEEFRSPFRWVPDTPPLPHSNTGNSNSDDSEDGVGGRPRRHRRDWKARTESRGEELEVERRSKLRKKKRTKTHAIAQGHKQLPSPTAKPRRNNSPPSCDPREPLLRLSIPVRGESVTSSLSIATTTISDCQDAVELEDASTSVLDTLQHDHEEILKLRNRTKKKVKRKPPKNVLALRFPVLVSKSPASHTQPSSSSIEDGNWSSSPSILLDKYTRELASLTQEEQRLEQGVLTRIAEEKARLPLTFLFEHNLLHRSDAQQDGLRIVTAIFAKLQHRLLFSGFVRWRAFLSSVRREERQQEVLRLARLRAVKLLERVSSDAYVGTLARALQRWKRADRLIIEQEWHQAATVIQTAFRTRRARQHLLILRQAAKARDHRRELAVQSLLRFERYGFTMKWGALRVGFDLARQTRAARNLQFFLRRVAVRRRIAGRVLRRQGVVLLQTQWRAHLARQEVTRRRIERDKRLVLEQQAAIQLQRRARGLLARGGALRQRRWLVMATQSACQLQQWIRRCWARAELQERLQKRRLLLEEARVQAAAEALAQRHRQAAVTLQCVLRGVQARTRYHRKLKERQMEQAVLFLQRFWRRRRGLYALGLRFAERRERTTQRRGQAAIVIQCGYRCFLAKQRCLHLARARETRRHAATIIQCQFRGWSARGSYQNVRLAVTTIQCAVRCALARRRRGRRLGATIKLQGWAKGVLLCRVARRVLEEMRVQEQRREALALLLQKRARQIEAQQTARLFREALKVVKIEQRRYFGTEDGGVQGGIGWATHQASSELLAFVTDRFLEDDTCFALEETRWLSAQVQAANERLAREDQAAIFLQRRYRGYATRLGYWVHRCQVEQLRQLKEVKAVVLQRISRGWLARRQTRRLREQRRKRELKVAYVRERRRKDEEREWKERVDREQMELRVQQAHEAEAQIREARREADIARIKAEAAAYRAQELAAELEIKAAEESLAARKTSEKGEEVEGDKWTEVADEFGNVYYCNERTGESCWDRPPPPPKKEKKPMDEEAEMVEADVKAEELKALQTKEEEECTVKAAMEEEERRVKAAKEEEECKVKAEMEEKEELERALREGKCRACRRGQATKQCLDCEDTAHAKFCTACFIKEHPRLPNSSEYQHDFAVLPSAQARVARCQSALHRDTSDSQNQQSPGLRLAAYLCLECTPATHPDSESESKLKLDSDFMLKSEPKLKLDAAGCFYCDECFAGSHETTEKLQHVEEAVQFCRGASLCCDCGHTLAVRICEQCGDKFCASCFVTAHTTSKRRLAAHTWTPLNVIREPLDSETDVYCVDCDLRASSRLCNLCGDGFCDSCFAVAHAKGAKRSHTWLPWAVAAQHGDWLEIQDNNATLFFNVETKESTATRPRALLPGDERHRLQLAEREQLQRRRQIELESEVVKLKEQLLQLQDSQQQQTQRRQRLGSHALKPTKHLEAPGEQKKPDGPKKAAKPGLLSRLYPRRPRSQPERNDVAPGETKGLTKEKSIGSPEFQQAVLQELAALAQTPSQPGSKPK